MGHGPPPEPLEPDAPLEVDGLVVRLDVFVPQPARAAEVAETLARQAAGFASEGIVASLIVHPDAVSIDHALDVDDDEEPT